MLFSGIPFLFYFLPCVLLLYAVAPRKLKNAVLLLVSLVFYAWGEPRLVILMLVTVLSGYVLALLTERFPNFKKLFLGLALVISLGFLGFFKYANFFLENARVITGLPLPVLNIALPIGISFYTFQILSYNIDVYRGDVPAQKNPIDLAAYIALFPQLIAGPIVRYSHIAAQLKHRTHTWEKTSLGIRRFIFGLGKKILIANSLGELCNLFKNAENPSVLFHWLYAIAFMLHIYFDFSGYSDMAIGLGKLFGFEFMENFNYPYISKSITEFWRRWHISLGSWFRDYVYFPLGGSRVKKSRMFFNIFLVWMLTGFWHGAAWNFILWGLFFAVLLVLEKVFFLKYLKEGKVLNHFYVLFAVMLSFVLFDAASMGDAFSTIGGLFGIGTTKLACAESLYYLKSYGGIFLIAILGATPLPKFLTAKSKLASYLEPIVLAALLLVCTAYLVDGSFNPFLYFRF